MSATITYADTDNKFADTMEITLQKILQEGAGSGSGGSGGSGSGDVQVYNNRNPAAPANTALAAVSYNTSTQVATWWNVVAQAWE